MVASLRYHTFVKSDGAWLFSERLLYVDADLTVVFHCSVTERTQFSTRSLDGWGWGPGWGRGRGWRRWGGGGTEITEVEQIPVGTLIVYIGDSSTKRYIWRGTATKTISSKPDKNAKAIDDVMKKMFEKFPPQGKR